MFWRGHASYHDNFGPMCVLDFAREAANMCPVRVPRASRRAESVGKGFGEWQSLVLALIWNDPRSSHIFKEGVVTPRASLCLFTLAVSDRVRVGVGPGSG